MDKLSLEQLKQIPWINKYITGPDIPCEPAPEDIPIIINIPFLKRDSKFGLFYTWLEIIRLVGYERPMKILDAACGRGQICQILHYYGHDVTGSDIENHFCADNDIQFVQADLDKSFPFPDNNFDIVINSTALHYLKSSEHFFCETKRILKNGGNVIFSIPNITSLGGRYYFLKTGKISEFSSAILDRKNFIYPDYVFELLKRLNFDIIEITGTVPIINLKIKFFDLIFGKFIFNLKNPINKYSSILVINAKINK